MTNKDLEITIHKVGERKNPLVVGQLILHDCKEIRVLRRGLFTTAVILNGTGQICAVGNAKRNTKDKQNGDVGETVAITKALRDLNGARKPVQVYDLEPILRGDTDATAP